MTPERDIRSLGPALAALLFFALVLRLGYGLSMYSGASWQASIDNYGDIARVLASEGRYADVPGGPPSITREPGFPLLLAAGYLLLRHEFAATLTVLCLLNLGTLLLLWSLARDELGERAGWAAAGLGAVYPFYVYYTVNPYRECAYAFFAMLCVWLWMRWLRAPSLRGAALLGAVNGWTCLVSFTHFPFAMLSAAAATLVLVREKRAARLAVFLLCFAGVYGLWPLRTYLHYGAFIISTPYAPFNLYVAMTVPPEAKGTPEEAVLTAKDPVLAEFDALRRDSPQEGYRLMVREGLAAVRARPRVYAGRVVTHFLKLWRLYPYPRQYDHGYGKLKWLSLLTEGSLIPAGLTGLFLFLRRTGARPLAVLALLHLFSISMIHSLSFAVMRHRLPVMGWFLMFAAYAAVTAADALRGRKADAR